MNEQLIPAQVFISYNHTDREIAKVITKRLLLAGHEVWVDKLEIHPGDSLIEKISEGLTDSSYLLVLLSKKSVSSNWVNRELEIAISRQLKDKSIKVIPCLIEDCEIPPFLQPILFADFRKDFEEGIAELLPSIKMVDLKTMGKYKDAEEARTHDCSMDWCFDRTQEERYAISIVIVSKYANLQGSVLFTIDIRAAENLRKRFDAYPEKFSGAIMMLMFIHLFKDEIVAIQRESNKDLGMVIDGPQLLTNKFTTIDEKGHQGFIVSTTIRYLGNPIDRDLVYKYGKLICDILSNPFEEIRRKIPPHLGKEYVSWIDENPMP